MNTDMHVCNLQVIAALELSASLHGCMKYASKTASPPSCEIQCLVQAHLKHRPPAQEASSTARCALCCFLSHIPVRAGCKTSVEKSAGLADDPLCRSFLIQAEEVP